VEAEAIPVVKPIPVVVIKGPLHPVCVRRCPV
jgi:hypothetical protein